MAEDVRQGHAVPVELWAKRAAKRLALKLREWQDVLARAGGELLEALDDGEAFKGVGLHLGVGVGLRVGVGLGSPSAPTSASVSNSELIKFVFVCVCWKNVRGWDNSF